MINEGVYHLDEDTISRSGFRPATTPFSTQLASNARVYEFLALENVCIMKNDFYGNKMPECSCFLAFYRRHGLLGR